MENVAKLITTAGTPKLEDVMTLDVLKATISEVKRLPHLISELLEHGVRDVPRIAEANHGRDFFLYLGRHVGLPVALEGALKLKEISYIATDAYAAGEMKHGPIALLDESTPVVVVATDSPVLEKVISNIQEVKARGARVIAVASEGNETIAEHADEVLHHTQDLIAAVQRGDVLPPARNDDPGFGPLVGAQRTQFAQRLQQDLALRELVSRVEREGVLQRRPRAVAVGSVQRGAFDDDEAERRQGYRAKDQRIVERDVPGTFEHLGLLVEVRPEAPALWCVIAGFVGGAGERGRLVSRRRRRGG